MMREPYILRDIDPLIGASLIGAGGGLLGSLIGGSGQKAAARQQAQLMERALNSQEGSALRNDVNRLAFLGGFNPQTLAEIERTLSAQQREQVFGRAARGEGFTAEQQAELADIERQLADARKSPRARLMGGGTTGVGRPVTQTSRIKALEERRQQLLDYAKGDPGTKGMFDRSQFQGNDTGIRGQYQNLIGEAENNRAATLGMFDGDTRRLLSEADALRGSVRDFGRGQIDRINRDAGEAVTGANRNALAAAIRTGNSGSALLNAQNANQRYITRDAQDQIGRLEDERLRMLTSLGSDKLNLAANRSNQRLGATIGLNDQVLAQKGQIPALDASVKFGQLGGTSGINYAAFVPATSAGIGTQALGNSLAQTGGTIFGAGLQGYLNQQKKPATATTGNPALDQSLINQINLGMLG